MWGAVKDKCYADKPELIDALKDSIREANIGEIQLHTNENVLKNWNDCVGCYTERTDALNDNIREAIGEIQLHIIDTYIHSWPLQRFRQDY